MMVAMGMGLRGRDFLRVLQRPTAFLFGTLAQIGLLPLVAFGIAHAFGLEASHAVGLVLIAACPGGATSNAFSQFARGDVALSVSLTAVSGLLSFLTVPLVVGLAIRFFAGGSEGADLGFVDTAIKLFTTTALPVALGMATLHWRPLLAERLRRPLLIAATFVVVAMVAGLGFALSGDDALRLFRVAGPAIAALMVTMAGIALLGGSALRLEAGQQRTIVIELAIQNFNLALVVALSILGNRLYLGPALIYLPFMLIFAGIVMAIGHRGRGLEGVSR